MGKREYFNLCVEVFDDCDLDSEAYEWEVLLMRLWELDAEEERNCHVL